MATLTSMAPGTSAHFNIFDEFGDRTGSVFYGRRID
jgi:hypothetical protein